ncbi:MAG: tetratricopeptide repeat protein [Flavobacteriales bacterium]|nr:tetratricopeptide repeat protein [Flavobacteriales bacterium]
MLRNLKLHLLFLLITLRSLLFSQGIEVVRMHYESFLEFEYSDQYKAKEFLDEGFRLAQKIDDRELVAEGFKYYSWYYDDWNEYDKALESLDSAEWYFKEQANTKEVINCYNYRGNILSSQALLDSSLYWYQKGLDLAIKKGDSEASCTLLNNTALVYMDLGDYVRSVDLFLEAVKICEELQDQESLGDVYNNLGTVFSQIEDYEQALFYHQKSLSIRKGSDNPVKISSVKLNIGRVFLATASYNMARSYFMESLSIDESLGDLDGMALNYNNIGLSYMEEGNRDSAFYFYSKSYEIRKELNDPFGLIMSHNNFGEYYLDKGNYDLAIDECLKGYQLGEELELPYDMAASCECLTEAYEKKGKVSEALTYSKKLRELENQIRSESNTKEITQKQMEYIFYNKNLQDSLRYLEKQKEKDIQHVIELKEKELEKERVEESKQYQLYIFLLLGLVLLVIAAIVFYSYSQQKKKNELIEMQNMVISEQKLEIDQSLEYAQLIQRTSLPSIKINEVFDESFLLYLPKEVVSGDFYWLESTKDHSYIAVADCTGHGIPGAFLSLIGTILLNEIYNSKQMDQPDKVLNELNRLLQLTMISSTGERMKDGMDIAFCRFDKKNRILDYAGANNSLWIISERESIIQIREGKEEPLEASFEHHGYYLFDLKADKQPIGHYVRGINSFRMQSVKLEKGDQFFLFTDGYADQFGGERGKKFKYKPFKRLLLSTSTLSTIERKERIELIFENWKEGYEQVDDVCVIGVRV